MLFTQIIHRKQPNTNNKENIFNLTVQYLAKYVMQYNSWHPGAGIEGTGKKSY